MCQSKCNLHRYTVAEVRQMSGDLEDEGGGMSVVAKGRLRFRVANLAGLRDKVRDAWTGGSTVVACGSVEVELIGEGSLAPPGPPRGAFAKGLTVCGGGGAGGIKSHGGELVGLPGGGGGEGDDAGVSDVVRRQQRRGLPRGRHTSRMLSLTPHSVGLYKLNSVDP
jgi:hypothetical protein